MTKALNAAILNSGGSRIRGNSGEEIMKQATAHAKTAHNMQGITFELVSKVRSAIREEGQAKRKTTDSYEHAEHPKMAI